MQKKRLRANELLNKLHRGAVYTCIGVTIWGSFMIGLNIYRYYTVIKPNHAKVQLQNIIEGTQDMAKELKS